MKNKIFVTKPLTPDLDEFIPYMKKIWESEIFTNNGNFHKEFEEALCKFLGVKYISLVANGTLALSIAIKALNLNKEIITTPFTYIATANSILWAGAKPVFVDIDPHSKNIDPNEIEKAINDKTCGILPVHAYGNLADVRKIKKIAKKNNLKVIYDAASCFGIKDASGSILKHGDLSILSFHATKVLNTFEGGAIISSNLKMKKRIDALINFGITKKNEFIDIGLNAKLSEINSAYGLLQLKHISEAIRKRKKIYKEYLRRLKNVNGIELIYSSLPSHDHNFSYFPIMINDEFPVSRDELVNYLCLNNIYVRKYYHPLITNLKIYKKYTKKKISLSHSQYISERVLCLPIYPNLNLSNVNKIIELILNIKN